MADVFGRMVADYHRDELRGQPIYERSDGDESPAHCAWYFAGPEEWGPLETAAIEACTTAPPGPGRVTPRVLDAGCGPGRALDPLAARGAAVLGVDESPNAIRVAREWTDQPAIVGDQARLPLADGAAIDADGDRPSDDGAAIDAALFLGTHVGGAGTIGGLRKLLEELDRVIADGDRGGQSAGSGRVVADLFDPTAVENDDLRAYLDGRWLDTPDAVGTDDSATEQAIATRRFRLRYDGEVGRWRTLLMASPAALEALVAPTAWSIAEIVRGEDTRYLFVLERE
ncbi:class I SAM-dependent methyltransferase [Salinarchaeum laminariae]|uniref:class I SAM-dependent methyltransferase n=1 Tax=Salinarchaeum laminariae TaxID=869888 RepID=UPI0020BE0BA1|nr:class I SAM-dependent methyltransferase [Salinarchaeum laminariae]